MRKKKDENLEKIENLLECYILVKAILKSHNRQRKAIS